MPQHSKRNLLLDAGTRRLLDSQPGEILRGLSAQAVADAAGTSRQTFYSHWPEPEDFLLEILDTAIDDPTIPEQLGLILARLWTDTGRTAEDVIRETCDVDFRLWSTNDAIRIELMFWLWARTCPDVAARMRSHYRAADAALVPAYARTLEILDRELVPEFDLTELATVFSALIDGLVIRHGFDPDAVREGLFGDVILALVLAVTRHAGTTETLAADVQALYDTEDVARARSGRTKAKRSVARIVRAADHLFCTRAYEAVSVRRIAASAGVTTGTLYQHFAGKDDILVAVWEPRMDALRRALDAVPTDDDPIGLIRGHLRRLADLGHGERYLAHALIQSVAAESVNNTTTEHSIRDRIDLPGLIVPAIEAAQERGLFRDAVPAREIAAVLTNNVVLRTFTRQSETPEQTVDSVCSFVLDGVRPRTEPT